MQDHPRVCGEKRVSASTSGAAAGSPPRMRGKGVNASPEELADGITPAYAGKSKSQYLTIIQVRDHPRVCGEKCLTAGYLRTSLGSPPRMRGKVLNIEEKKRKKGITPAYAGKRLKRSHRIGHFSCILCLFHSVLHRASASGGSRAGPCAPPCLPAQNAVPV